MPGVEAGHAPASVLELGVCEPHPVYGTGSVAEPRKATLDGFRVWASKLGVAGLPGLGLKTRGLVRKDGRRVAAPRGLCCGEAIGEKARRSTVAARGGIG